MSQTNKSHEVFAGVDRPGQQRESAARLGSTEHLSVFGTACILSRDFEDCEIDLLQCFEGDAGATVDRFDARLLLSTLPPQQAHQPDRHLTGSEEQQDQEETLELERYKDLWTNPKISGDTTPESVLADTTDPGTGDGGGTDSDQSLGVKQAPATNNINAGKEQEDPPAGAVPDSAFAYDYGGGTAAGTGSPGTGPETESILIQRDFDPPFKVPPSLAGECPRTLQQHQVIMRTAAFVRSGGLQAGFRLGVKMSSNPHFGFLSPSHCLHSFYRWALRTNPEAAAHGPALPTALDLLAASYDTDSGSEASASLPASPQLPSQQHNSMHDALLDGQPDSLAHAIHADDSGVGEQSAAKAVSDGNEAGEPSQAAAASGIPDLSADFVEGRISHSVLEQHQQQQQWQQREEQQLSRAGLAIMARVIDFVKVKGATYGVALAKHRRSSPHFEFMRRGGVGHATWRAAVLRDLGTKAAAELLRPPLPPCNAVMDAEQRHSQSLLVAPVDADVDADVDDDGDADVEAPTTAISTLSGNEGLPEPDIPEERLPEALSEGRGHHLTPEGTPVAAVPKDGSFSRAAVNCSTQIAPLDTPLAEAAAFVDTSVDPSAAIERGYDRDLGAVNRLGTSKAVRARFSLATASRRGGASGAAQSAAAAAAFDVDSDDSDESQAKTTSAVQGGFAQGCIGTHRSPLVAPFHEDAAATSIDLAEQHAKLPRASNRISATIAVNPQLARRVIGPMLPRNDSPAASSPQASLTDSAPSASVPQAADKATADSGGSNDGSGDSKAQPTAAAPEAALRKARRLQAVREALAAKRAAAEKAEAARQAEATQQAEVVAAAQAELLVQKQAAAEKAAAAAAATASRRRRIFLGEEADEPVAADQPPLVPALERAAATPIDIEARTPTGKDNGGELSSDKLAGSVGNIMAQLRAQDAIRRPPVAAALQDPLLATANTPLVSSRHQNGTASRRDPCSSRGDSRSSQRESLVESGRSASKQRDKSPVQSRSSERSRKGRRGVSRNTDPLRSRKKSSLQDGSRIAERAASSGDREHKRRKYHSSPGERSKKDSNRTLSSHSRPKR